MGYTDEGKNSMLNWLQGTTTAGGKITHIALHSGTNITTSGTALEISTVGNIYERKPCSFGAAAGGKIVEATAITFTVPAGSTVSAVSFWGSSATSGKCLAYTTVPDETYVAQGSYTITASTLDLNL